MATKKTTKQTQKDSGAKSQSKLTKKKLTKAVLHVEATFNNTKVVVTDTAGNSLFWSSAGSLGFKGAKKGTPFAATKVGEVLSEKAEAIGIKEIDVVIRGVGSGREPAMRAFVARGFELGTIKDETPVPHNGPRAKKPRRV